GGPMTQLPVADGPDVRRYAMRILRRHPGALALTVLLFAGASLAGLAAPRLIGDLVEAVGHGATPRTVDTTVVAIAAFVLVPPLVIVTRWYLRRAPAGYLRENAAYSDITDGLAETVEGARTIEALHLAQRRRERTDRDISRSWAAERYTLFLRTMWFPVVET